MKDAINIVWFRQDLRLLDNPALFHACSTAILPVYILDDVHAGANTMGAASRVWLHHSLQALKQSLGGHLCCYQGDPLTVLLRLLSEQAVAAVYWNRCYEPWGIQRDQQIKQALLARGIEVESFNGSLLWEPWTIKKDDGSPYRVFTPFYRKGCLHAQPPRQPLAEPEVMTFAEDAAALAVDDLSLLPDKPWYKKVIASWTIGEQGAWQRLRDFLSFGVKQYREGRDFPSKDAVSRLSPHLHFGELSVHQVWHAARQWPVDRHVEHFCSELAWREFSYSQLYYHPELPTQNLQSKFDAMVWREDEAFLHAWQRGQTGIPIVDAGMRELWHTGYMHNRVRMIVASFLVKNGRIDWRKGERWFWDCLFDADLANNSASWQWVAGCGADAAPYFRIFNPVTQGQKFDPQGTYTRRWLPELKDVPERYLFAPWQAPVAILQAASVVLGRDYPRPILDLQQSRQAALEAFAKLKQVSQ